MMKTFTWPRPVNFRFHRFTGRCCQKVAFNYFLHRRPQTRIAFWFKFRLNMMLRHENLIRNLVACLLVGIRIWCSAKSMWGCTTMWSMLAETWRSFRVCTCQASVSLLLIFFWLSSNKIIFLSRTCAINRRCCNSPLPDARAGRFRQRRRLRRRLTDPLYSLF